ncbi:MAG: hypothetical protein ACOX3O_08535 [bacterium]
MQRLVDTVHKYGTKIFIQLHHPGREGHARINPNNNQIVAPTAMVTERCTEMPHELTTEEVEALVRKFVVGAVIAKGRRGRRCRAACRPWLPHQPVSLALYQQAHG